MERPQPEARAESSALSEDVAPQDSWLEVEDEEAESGEEELKEEEEEEEELKEEEEEEEEEEEKDGRDPEREDLNSIFDEALSLIDHTPSEEEMEQGTSEDANSLFSDQPENKDVSNPPKETLVRPDVPDDLTQKKEFRLAINQIIHHMKPNGKSGVSFSRQKEHGDGQFVPERKRRFDSPSWDHVTIIEGAAGNGRCICNHCKVKMSANYSTNVTHHLKRECKYKNLINWDYNPTQRDAALLFSFSGMSLNAINDPHVKQGIREDIAKLTPHRLGVAISKEATFLQNLITDVLRHKMYSCSYCITTDSWTSPEKIKFINVVVSKLDDLFFYQEYLVRFEGQPIATAEAISATLESVFKDLQLNKDRICGIVTDGGGNYLKSARYVLPGSSYRCTNHRLHNAVMDAVGKDYLKDLLARGRAFFTRQISFFQKNLDPKDFAELKKFVLKPDHPSMTRWSSYLRSLDIILRMTCQCVNVTNELVDNGHIAASKVPPTPSLPGDPQREYSCSLRSLNKSSDQSSSSSSFESDGSAPQTPTKRGPPLCPNWITKSTTESLRRYLNTEKKETQNNGMTLAEFTKCTRYQTFLRVRDQHFNPREKEYFHGLLAVSQDTNTSQVSNEIADTPPETCGAQEHHPESSKNAQDSNEMADTPPETCGAQDSQQATQSTESACEYGSSHDPNLQLDEEFTTDHITQITCLINLLSPIFCATEEFMNHKSSSIITLREILEPMVTILELVDVSQQNLRIQEIKKKLLENVEKVIAQIFDNDVYKMAEFFSPTHFARKDETQKEEIIQIVRKYYDEYAKQLLPTNEEHAHSLHPLLPKAPLFTPQLPLNESMYLDPPRSSSSSLASSSVSSQSSSSSSSFSPFSSPTELAPSFSRPLTAALQTPKNNDERLRTKKNSTKKKATLRTKTVGNRKNKANSATTCSTIWPEPSLLFKTAATFTHNPQVELNNRRYPDAVAAHDEIDSYLHLAKCEKSRRNEATGLKEYSVFDFWRDKAHRFPILRVLARELGVIRATSVTSERVFSVSGKFSHKRRPNVSSKSLPKQVYLRFNTLQLERYFATGPVTKR